VARYFNETNFEDKMMYLYGEAKKRLTLTEALRDGHDYFNEVLGATVLPLLGLAATIGLLFAAAYQGILTLINNCFPDCLDGGSNTENYEENAQELAFLALVSFSASVASLLNSIVSLVSRPIMTAINNFSFKEQDVARFYNDDHLVNQGLKLIDNLVN
jgi:hypothetical protein